MVGSSNRSTARQDTNFSSAGVDQSGTGNNSDIVQTQNSVPSLRIVQSGLASDSCNAFNTQAGTNNESHIIQSGRDGDATVYQTGKSNYSLVTEEGRRDTAFFEQNGNRNRSTWDQSVTTVFANFVFNFKFGVHQTGDDKISSISQTSSAQQGVNNTVIQTVYGNFPLDNDVDVTQVGTFKNSRINQGGSTAYTAANRNAALVFQVGDHNGVDRRPSGAPTVTVKVIANYRKS